MRLSDATLPRFLMADSVTGCAWVDAARRNTTPQHFLPSNRLPQLSGFPLTWEDVTIFAAVLPFCPDHQGRWEDLAGLSKNLLLGADGAFKLRVIAPDQSEGPP